MRPARDRTPVWQGGSVGERCVGKRRRRQSSSANDIPGRTGTRHRRAIGIIVPVVALIHADGLNSESQRGSAPRPATKAAFASGCRGEFENPALRFCKEYIPEMPLGKAGQTLRGNSVSRVSTVSRGRAGGITPQTRTFSQSCARVCGAAVDGAEDLWHRKEACPNAWFKCRFTLGQPVTPAVRPSLIRGW